MYDKASELYNNLLGMYIYIYIYIYILMNTTNYQILKEKKNGAHI